MAKRRARYFRCILTTGDGQRTVEGIGKTETQARTRAKKKAKELGLQAASLVERLDATVGIQPRTT